MASPRASRWPPPPLLLPPLLLLLLLPPPAAPEPRGQPPSPARRALLPGAGPEREPPPSSPPRERRGPAPPGPGPAVPAPGSAPRRGRSGRMPRAASAAAVQSHQPESHSTESHLQNSHFHQSQEGPSTVDSRKSATAQTTRTSHTSSETPGSLTLLTESAGAQQTNGTASPARHSPEVPMTLTSQGSTVSSKSFPLPSSSSESDSGISPGSLETMRGLPEEGTVYTQVVGTSASSQFPLHASKPGEPTVFSEKRNSLRPEHSELPFSGTPPHSPPSDHSSSSASITEPNNSSACQSPSGGQTKSTHVASTFTNGVPRTVRSLTVSVGPVSEMERFPKDSETDTTSTSVRSSPSVAELRTSSKLTETPGDGDVPEHSVENAFGLTSLQWQSDTPTIGGHQLASNSEAGNGSSILQTETVFRSVSSTKSGESTAPWQLTNTEASADVTESSASHPEAANTTVFGQFSDSAQQPQGGNSGSHERSYSETPSTSSESLDSSAPLGERSRLKVLAGYHVCLAFLCVIWGSELWSFCLHAALEDSLPPSDSSELPESTSGLRSRSAHTLATLTRSGERTLRSLGSARATPRGNVTDHAGLLSRSPAAAPALGVTALSYGQVNGTDTEPRTPGGHTEHTYVSPTFTKGERALLSITDNHSSSDIGESSTSYIKISNSPYLSYSPPSRTQSERSNISDDKYAQSSTESLALHLSSVPSYTSTVHVPDTLVLLGAKTKSAGDSSPAGAPVPPPAVSQPQELFSSASPSTRSSIQQLKSTSDAAKPLSSSPSSVPISLMASTLAPHSVSPTTLPQSSSTLVLHRVRETRVTSFQTATIVSVVHSSQTADPKNKSMPHQEKTTTVPKSPTPVSVPTDSTKAVTASSPLRVPLPPAVTDSPTKPVPPTTSTGLVYLSPALTATTSQIAHSPVTTPSTLSATESLVPGPAAVHTTVGKELLPTHPDILVPQVSTESTVTTEGSQAHVVTTTPSIPPTIVPTSAKGSTTRPGNTEEYSPASHFLRTSPQTTDVSTTKAVTAKSTTFAAQSTTRSPAAMSPPTSVNSCAMNPCLHDGECVVDVTGRGYRCVCSPSWQGDNCSEDVNECLSNPCPPLAMCNNTQGSFVCRCPVGYQLEKGICNLVRTFVTEFKLRKPFLNATVDNHSELHEFEKEIIQTLNMCFSSLPGYIRSAVRTSREPSAMVIFLQTTFSLASNVTLFDLGDGIQKYVNSCRSSAEVCQLLGSQRRVFKAGSLCKRKSPECDKETSICTDLDGVALCQCKSGYFQFNKMDHSCRACEDGYRLENETCMSCPFGLGGLNCGNPYQLITVVIAAAGGGLLLILGIALIVTCCRKSKNDISKLIFKSGDFQMSPYAEYPKNPRSQEWGRDAIEMHENGSTKNLLQMTDVYCSPSNIRNPELERNGLYPAYTGLPGSRHSCIFPGQYNPSFISDDSRRRDYF